MDRAYASTLARRIGVRPKRRAGARIRAAVAPVAILLVGCSSAPAVTTAGTPSASVSTVATSPPPSPSAVPVLTLGNFPPFPRSPLPARHAASLQAVLDGLVEDGTMPGVAAAVVLGGSGSWSGAAGVDSEEHPLTPDARLLLASVGKTVTAAQILRLVEEGAIGLDDPIADHLPPEVAFFDANGATIRDVLGMRSGIIDPPDYVEFVDRGPTPAALLHRIPEPFAPPGSGITYANINFALLGMVIEHVTGSQLWDALRAGVLDHPGLDGLRYGQKGALAADGWAIESDPATLARWGYELYGGFVLSGASLREMTDFRGDWYGLGTIDFSQETPAAAGYGVPAIGHGGMEPPSAALLVAFPETPVVIAVQAPFATLEQVHEVVAALKDAAQA